MTAAVSNRESVHIASPVGFDSALEVQRNALRAAVEGTIAKGLDNPEVSDVLVDPSGAVFFDYLDGRRERQVGEDLRPSYVRSIIVRIAGMLDKTLETGLLEGEVPLDGSRIQAWLPPLVPAPSLVIRIHRRQGANRPTLDTFLMSPPFREVVERIARDRLNGLVIGSTGSGKTTFLGAILDRIAEIHPADRIITIEDTFELYCRSESWLPLRASADVTQRMLLKSAKRGLPTWIIPGEVRDEVAIDMVEALKSGHAGLSSAHASSCELGLSLVHEMCRGTKTMEQVASAFHYVIEMRRKPLPDGSRYPHAICEVVKTGDRYHLEPVAA